MPRIRTEISTYIRVNETIRLANPTPLPGRPEDDDTSIIIFKDTFLGHSQITNVNQHQKAYLTQRQATRDTVKTQRENVKITISNLGSCLDKQFRQPTSLTAAVKR